ncbi:WASH complex subunit 3 [Agrilus planipennis]|uniref:WASH complex subunit 3 n=1 Tax=Agrilus planipennis TaxID=224129 RepID=A0A1W4WXW8_AGRPL|nr:WASH complex subunit 3 [Agrilus planipennis]
MEEDEFPAVSPSVDFNKILPIHQKRIIAFINHFVTTTVCFLNSFTGSCESKLMNVEHKMQRLESSLLILESHLSSMSSLRPKEVTTVISLESSTPLELPEVTDCCDENKENIEENVDYISTASSGNVTEDPKLAHFMKMLHVGVPLQAVRIKMQLEGVDPSLLDKAFECAVKE